MPATIGIRLRPISIHPSAGDTRLTLLRLHRSIHSTAKDPLIHETLVILPHDLGTEDHPVLDELGVRRREVGEEKRSDEMQHRREEGM